MEYKRKEKHVLLFAGLVDPKLMVHHPRPRPELLEKQDKRLESGMRLLIERSVANPVYTRGLVIRFTRDRSATVSRGEVTDHAVKNCIWPIKLALEMNDVPISSRKLLKLVPRSPRVGKDGEYTLEEIRRMLPHVSLHVRVPILFMCSSEMRVGAFVYLKVGDVSPLVEGDKLVCGKVVVCSWEGDTEYEALISEAYLAFKD